MKKLSLFNTLTRKREDFEPIDKNLVRMYVCGPTVYDRPHIGNARSSVVYDVLYRVLNQLYGKDKVVYVRNITDIDDKIMMRASELGVPIQDLTKKAIIDFNNDMNYLSCLKPTHQPKATEHIQDMVAIIQKLLDVGIAYWSNGHVYFDISKTSNNYLALSMRTFGDAYIIGVTIFKSIRIEPDANKRHVADFILWKAARENDDEFARFSSPFGPGRPGWHIECSAMSNKFLGESFDIHGGGVDLVFPHHTNEIAQSCSAFPGSTYARYWVHNGTLTVEGKKMSKSLGNFITVNDFIDRKIDGDAVRLLLLATHYQKPLNYNRKALDDAVKMLHYWHQASQGLVDDNEVSSVEQIPEEFLDCLLDNLNTPKAIKVINDFAKKSYSSVDKETKLIFFRKMSYCAMFIGLMGSKK